MGNLKFHFCYLLLENVLLNLSLLDLHVKICAQFSLYAHAYSLLRVNAVVEQL